MEVQNVVNTFLQHKFNISKSKKTVEMYLSVLVNFRDFLHEQNYDLFPTVDASYKEKELYSEEIAQYAKQFFAVENTNTSNLRRSVINSFYTDSEVQSVIQFPNPIQKKRSKRRSFITIENEKFEKCLREIDMTTLLGLRDASLICAMLEMEISSSTLKKLKTNDVFIEDETIIVIVNYTHIKLSQFTGRLLLKWLEAKYGHAWSSLSCPIWINFSSSNRGEIIALTAQGITGVMLQRLNCGTPFMEKQDFLSVVNKI